MRNSRWVWIPFSMLFGLEGVVAGQAMLEGAMGIGRAATSTAPARGVKKVVGGVVGSVDKVMKAGHEASDSESSAAEAEATSVEPPVPAVPAKIYEDPRGIRAGMAMEELTRRFGPPTLEVVGASNGRLLTYSGKSGIIQLELRGERVVVIAAMTPQQAAVILPVGQTVRP